MPAIWYNSFIITYHELIPLRISWSSNKDENDSPNLSILIAFLDFGPPRRIRNFGIQDTSESLTIDTINNCRSRETDRLRRKLEAGAE